MARLHHRGVLRDLYRDRRGVTAVMFALMLPVIVGFVALGVEIAFWYMSHRSLQTAADAAAIAGLYEKKNGSTTTVRDAQAVSEAVRNGYNSSTGTFTLNPPPLSGSYTTDSNAIEVLLSEPRELLFSGIFLGSDVTITGRGVATLGLGSQACILALSPTASKAIDIGGTTTLSLAGCNVAANSDADDAINQGGGGTLTADCLSTMGDTSGTFNLTCSNPLTGAPETPDPYSGLSVDPIDVGSCDYTGGPTGYTPSDGETLNPGTYCNGIKVVAGVNITMNPGTYYMDGGGFTMSGGATDTGAGVTIVLTSHNESGYGDVDIAGGATMTLSAPTSGDYSGILFYQDQNAPTASNLTSKFTGGSTMELTGVLYFPKNAIEFTGGNATTGNCTKVVGLTVDFSGNAKINNDCAGTGVPPIQQLDRVTLVE